MNNCTPQKPATIIWDFDGTLIPNDPYDSEQSLMLYQIHQGEKGWSVFTHALARLLIYADRQERLRKVFKRFYIRFLTGSSVDIFDPVCTELAAKISDTDRGFLKRLSQLGHPMIVLSCGTVNLSEGTLQKAGLADCFDQMAGNRFESQNGKISSMTLLIPNPQDKVKFLIEQRIDHKRCIAVGEVYTDIPMLDWAKISILVDRTGRKQEKYANKDYHFVRSLSEILYLV